MKKLILILLCLPVFVFSQEEKKYSKTMSVSQFAKELKQAAEQGIGYTLKNCMITYNPINDKKYVIDNTNDEEYTGDAVIKDISFNDSTSVVLNNCKFGKSTTSYYATISFLNCNFGGLILDSLDKRIFLTNTKVSSLKMRRSKNSKLYIDSCIIDNLYVINTNYIDIERSEIVKSEFNGIINKIRINNNKLGKVSLANNFLDANINSVMIYNNIIHPQHNDLAKTKGIIISLNSEKKLSVWLNAKDGIRIGYDTKFENSDLKISKLYIQDNIFYYHQHNEVPKDTLLKYLRKRTTNIFKWHALISPSAIKKINKTKYIIDTTWSRMQRKDFILQYIEKTDSLQINGAFAGQYLGSIHSNQRNYTQNRSDINIYGIDINELYINNNNLSTYNISDNRIQEKLTIKNTIADSLISMEKNILPNIIAIDIDSSVLNNFGFHYKKNKITLNQKLNLNDTTILKNSFVNELHKSSMQLRQFINIFNSKGSNLKNATNMQLKNLQTNIYCLNYYINPGIQKWFNWQGSEFLRWYSDYGMNPFKALFYCFRTMLYFAMFYFIFYNDWDKIDRGFLIKRFNSVMDYFTTEKRIEDFYSTTHDKEMTTFTDFKETLDKNKVYMPSMLASLAKPIYQISLLRYKLLNFSYKKAEFMAGRKWVDLEKKDRYWIGTLTFFLTLTYITYLIFIRALNSIALSVNAFSTLGFGQIPVRGFTKYVAIIEGFIGWFMLSVFIVSLLSQMMSV